MNHCRAGDWLVGRDREVARLRGLLARLEGGTGAAVLVDGEQGIGKTEVLRAGLAGAADLGCRVIWAAADELDRQFPLGLMAECLGVTAWSSGMSQEALADTGSSMPAGDPVLAAMERMLALVDRWCADSPTVLVTEDLHWADEASLLVWRRLSRTVGQLPLLLAGSMRPAPGREDLARMRPGVAASGGSVLSLGPLPEPEVAELVGRVVHGGSAEGRVGRRLTRMVGQAGGNPLYVRELVDGLVREGRVRVSAGVAELAGEAPEPDVTTPVAVPVLLAKMIEGRLEQLSEAATQLLPWAAVLGQELLVADLEAVTERPTGHLAEAIAEAVAAKVIADTGPRLAFRHGLIRQTVYDGMPTALRAAMHLKAARLLADAGAGPGKVAAHLVAVPGSAPGWMRNWLVRAAPALIYQAPEVAAKLLRAALTDLAGDSPEREPLEAYLVRVAFMRWQHEEVETTGTRLLAGQLDPDRRAEIAWFVAYARLRRGQAAEAGSLIEQELARLGPGLGLEAAHWARLRALQAMTLTEHSRPDEMAEIATEALASAEATGDRLGIGYALHVMFTVSALSRDWASGLSFVDRALAAIGTDPQAVDLRLILLTNRALLLSHLARLEEAITTNEQALAIAEQAGAYRLGFIRTQLAAVYYASGRWDDALAELETAIAAPGPGGDRVGTRGLAALIAAHRGDWTAADEHLAVVGDIPAGEVMRQHNPNALLMARALAAERSGGAAEGVAVLAHCLDPGAAELMPDRYVLLPAATRLAVRAGEMAIAAAALAVAEREEAAMTRSGVAGYCRGLVKADPAALTAAAGSYRAGGQLFECAQALEDAAELLARDGDVQAARDAFTEATGHYEAMGASWDIDRANARLRPHGLRHRQQGRRGRPATGWDALTPTETKIADLIGEGKSNSDIAAHLFLSRTTVYTHVSHILAKISAQSRAEIVREALSHPA